MRRIVRATAVAIGLSACTLITDLDGLSGPADGGPAARSDAAAGDGGSLGDGSLDAKVLDGGGDAGQGCGSTGPTNGLLAYYPFDEGTGNAVHDCSPNHFDGTFIRQGDGGSWVAGKKGGAIRVDAPNGCVDLGTRPELQPPSMTVAAWIDVAGLPVMGASGYIVGQAVNADVAGWRIGARYTNAVGWENTSSGTSYYVDTPAPPLGTWHHVAMTFKPNDKVEIFIDGTSTKVQSAVPPIAFVAVSMRIGCRSDDVNYFSGMIDELRMYDRVLTPAEIATLAAR